ncbi:MAG: leucine-rich repeat domain-containing protein [Paludibacteraceae bacterium]|nr:leucine-rich repeat domain-containing protein [Paludibacteraceae bacterium]
MLKKLLVSLLSAFLCISVVAEPESQLNGNQNETDVKIDENGDVFVAPLKYHISSDSTAEVINDYSYKKLESVVIPSEIRVDGHVYSVTSIGDIAFSFCSGLTNIEIPYSVTSIGYGTFRSCSGLTSIEIPSSVTSIGGTAFSGCSGLTSIEIPSSVTIIGDEAFCDCWCVTNIKIPSSVKVIGDEAFVRCSDLTSIEIPSSVTSIGNLAFFCCYRLTSIKIPSSVTSIGEHAFTGCSGLTSINVSGDNLYYSSEEGILYDKNKTVLICIPGGKKGSVEIPSSVKSIEKGTLLECSGLTSINVSIDNPNYSSEEGILYDKNKTVLISVSREKEGMVEIPSSVTIIGDEAFRDCHGLRSVKFPKSVTSIGKYAFSGCNGLTSIEIPKSVTSIGEYAFTLCSGLTSINVSRNNPNYSSVDGILYDKNKTVLISVPYRKKGMFKMLSSVTSIGNGAFDYCRDLTSIEIPSRVTSIGDHAFRDCRGLTSIEIPSSVSSIGEYAFVNCKGLTSIKIPLSVTSIGEYAFYNCRNLEIFINNSKENLMVGDAAFYGCKSVKFLK